MIIPINYQKDDVQTSARQEPPTLMGMPVVVVSNLPQTVLAVIVSYDYKGDVIDLTKIINAEGETPCPASL